jgi:hypothetical protein
MSNSKHLQILRTGLKQNKMHKNLFPFISLLFILVSCNLSNKEIKNRIEGSWQLYDIASQDENADFSKVASLKQKVKEGALLSLFEDDTYTEISGSGKYESGKWVKQDNKSILLTNKDQRSESAVFTVEKNKSGTKYNSLQIRRNKIMYKYIKGPNPLVKFKDDPFHQENNAWRAKSSSPETRQDLHFKMREYFKHLALILNAATERKQNVVVFQYSMGPVKIYDGAIGIYPYPIVPQEWKDTFYSDSSALAAYTIFKNYLTKSDYNGASSGNWIEDDYNILLSIYADFKNLD